MNKHGIILIFPDARCDCNEELLGMSLGSFALRSITSLNVLTSIFGEVPTVQKNTFAIAVYEYKSRKAEACNMMIGSIQKSAKENCVHSASIPNFPV